MDQRRVATKALHACLRLQRSQVQWVPGLRTGTLIAIALLIGLAAGRVDAAMSVSIGLLFVAIADTADSRAARLRGMLWATLWVGVGVLLGGLVSDFRAIHVVVAIILALACGYAGALGPRGGLIGVLALVLFAFYAGTDVVVDIAVLDTGYFVIGGLITIVVNLLTTPPRRLGTVRTSIAHAYRELQDAAQRRGLELAAPTVAAAVMSARTVADHQGCTGASAAWVRDLLSAIERSRLTLIALIAERTIDPAYVDGLTVRLSATAGAIADEIASPLGPLGRQGRRAHTRAALVALQDTARQAPDPRLGVLAGDIADAIASAVVALDEPWPIGARADISPPPLRHASVSARLRAHLHRSDPVLEHAIRLTVAFGGATLASVIVDVSHAYWVPLTVAWIAKPDLANTVSRVAMRIAGTLAGLVIVAAILLIVRDLPAEDIILSIVVGATGTLALAYLNANYPLAVIGVTSFVLLVEHETGDGERYDIIARLIATVLAGLWVLLVASVRPRRTGAQAVSALHATTAALRDYAVLVRAGEDTSAARTRVLSERTAALAAVSAASLETPGVWERPGGRVDPEQAAAVLTDVIASASSILAEEMLEERGPSDPALWQRIDAELDDLDARVDRLSTPSAT
jgi:uncharacterized membrane protein YccC